MLYGCAYLTAYKLSARNILKQASNKRRGLSMVEQAFSLSLAGALATQRPANGEDTTP
jgi:hypothetical protein